MFSKLKAAFSNPSSIRETGLDEALRLCKDKVRISCDKAPLELILGQDGKKLYLIREEAIDGTAVSSSSEFLLLDPESLLTRIGGFLRLTQGDTLVLGSEDEYQQSLFGYPKNKVDRRHLKLVHEGASLLFKDLSAESGTHIARLSGPEPVCAIKERRLNCLREIREIYGGSVEQLAPAEALDTLKQVNELLEKEPCRPKSAQDAPGGVVTLPDKMIPIIIGDLHAQVDNLLTLLSQNEFLEAMGDGKAAMVFLGDAVHKEVDGEMEEMESSLLMMDLIFRLKLWFPQQVFYVRGNHDCFSEDVGKGGIPQGLLWDVAMRKARGEEYKKEMDRFYGLLPYVAVSGDFAACHAAPPKSKVTLDMLINARQYPGLIRELTCNRLYAPNRPAGYTRGDVKRLRKTLDLAADAELFVGHTPLTRHDTLWLDVAGIKNHHVVFSGNWPWIGVFTRVGGRLVPLRYRSERLLPIVNAF